MIKIWRSPYSDFGSSSEVPNDLLDETVTADKVYSDQALAEIAASGFNAIWIHGLLHHIITESTFPELGKNSIIHQQNLNNLILRASKYGIKVYLYMQPPRALPISYREFWKNHPDVAGQIENITDDKTNKPFQVYSMCTSTEKVQIYLKNASAKLAKILPNLGGIILITASEYPAHCLTRRGMVLGAAGEIEKMAVDCPRCAERLPEDIISELITLVRDGVKSVSDSIKIIAWNWSWSFHVNSPCEKIISKLPQDIILMVGFERGGKKNILGHKNAKVDEYSISYAGPSPQFTESMKLAKKYDLQCLAKLQFGTTHELATVPSLPLIGNLFEKALYLKENKLAGFMGCWNFGNMITANTAAFNWFLSDSAPTDKIGALKLFADKYFLNCNADKVIESWDIFAKAMNNYPFCIPYLYAGPTNYALSFISYPAPLNKKSAGRSWLLDERGDDLSSAINDFTLDEIIEGFNNVANEWNKGISLLKIGLSSSDNKHAAEEIANAEVCGATFLSTYNLFRLYKLRLDWNDNKLAEYSVITEEEIKNLKNILPYIEQDKRFGYHSEAHGYMFNADMIKHKIAKLEKILTQSQIVK
jgi:hypothetical protein